MARTCTSRPARHPACGWPARLRTLDDEPSFTAEETRGPRRVHHVARDPRDLQRDVTKSTSPTACTAPGASGSTPTTSGRRSPWPCAGCDPGATTVAELGLARSGHPTGRGDAGPRPGHRPDRFGKDDHVGGHGRPHQPHCDRATSSPSRIRSSTCTPTIWPPSTSARSGSTPTPSPRPCGWSSGRTPT